MRLQGNQWNAFSSEVPSQQPQELFNYSQGFNGGQQPVGDALAEGPFLNVHFSTARRSGDVRLCPHLSERERGTSRHKKHVDISNEMSSRGC